MTTKETHVPPTSDGRREPFAILNLTWVVAIAATLWVLAKVYSVSGLSTDGATLILRSTDILQILTGTVLSDIQILSVVILLFVMSLYMEAEWPVPGRHEREVNLLAAVVVVTSIIVYVVAPWPLAILLQIVATDFLANRTGPIHFLASRGLLGKRLRSLLEDQQRRSHFRHSLPEPVVDALRRGDATEALEQLTDPPPFAREELESLVDDYSPTTGMRAFQTTFARFAALVTGIALFGLLVSPRPWVPSERILVKSGVTQTGYVLGRDGEQLIVLWADNRKLETINAEDVASRSVCQKGKHYTTLPQLFHLVKTGDYTRCP